MDQYIDEMDKTQRHGGCRNGTGEMFSCLIHIIIINIIIYKCFTHQVCPFRRCVLSVAKQKPSLAKSVPIGCFEANWERH